MPAVVKNALGAGIFLLLLVFLTFGFFRWFTRHGEEITVPNAVGMPMQEALELLDDASLEGVFADTLFDVPDSLKHVGKGSVLEQIPQAGSLAKGGRKIRLFIRALGEARISVPDYHSMRFQRARISNSTNLSFRPQCPKTGHESARLRCIV